MRSLPDKKAGSIPGNRVFALPAEPAALRGMRPAGAAALGQAQPAQVSVDPPPA